MTSVGQIFTQIYIGENRSLRNHRRFDMNIHYLQSQNHQNNQNVNIYTITRKDLYIPMLKNVQAKSTKNTGARK